MSGLNKIRLKVIQYSSEDPDYPASQLNEVHPTTKGWQSVRFCTYPQEVGFQMLDGEARITQIQLLSHQSKVSSKVEIYIGKGNNYDTASFKRLGYLSLDNNERSGYQARELKTVFIDHIGSFLKLIIYENHVNKVNVYNQVGIVAVSLLGADDDAKAISSSDRGEKDYAKPVYKNPYYDLTIDINLDPQTASKLRQLAEAKAKAISSEDYITAKQIKVVEQELKSLGSRLAQLDMAKSEAVAAEDYDLAKEIKDECDTLRSDIEQKIRAISIPGVRLNSAGSKGRAVVQEDSSAFDSLPVGRSKPSAPSQAAPAATVDSYHTSNKKAVKVEPMEHFDERPIATQGQQQQEEQDEDSLPLMDRPIRPKAQPSFDDKEMAESELASTGMPAERFAPGEHPLEGVPGCHELPTPELLNAKARELCETQGVSRLLGDYRARCLFSKSWNLREACVLKLQRLLLAELSGELPSCMQGLGAVLKLGAEDKIQQVLFSAMALLESVLKEAKLNKLSKGLVGPALEPVIVQLVDKVADGNARLREGAKKGLDLLSASPLVGAHAVAAQLVKPLPAKQKTGWRPLTTRLQLLTELVQAHGVGPGTALQTDMLLNFPKSAQAYAHSNKEVRDAAKELVVAIQQHLGTGAVESTLELLRKNQKEEYLAAFEAAASAAQSKPSGRPNANPKAAAKAAPMGREADTSPSSKRTDKAHQHAPQHPGGKVPTSSQKVQQQRDGYAPQQQQQHSPEGPGAGADDGEQQSFTSCMFCSVQNKNWQENDLDLHYWKDCPLLISCPSCAQIVEIAGLPEHLLDECDAKSSYVPCDVTGLAIRANEYDAWRNGGRCVPAPDNFMYCPLCLSSVEDSDDAWMGHLTKKCPKNTRIHQNSP